MCSLCYSKIGALKENVLVPTWREPGATWSR